jgi:hypothetical protein
MVKCTAMAKALPKVSPKKPSMRAQECTAYPTPMITGSGVLQRQTGWILINSRKGCDYGKYTKKSTD